MENPKKRNWKVLTSEYLARKPWFTVRHEHRTARRAPHTDYYVFEYPDWVNVIAITKEGNSSLSTSTATGWAKRTMKSRRA